MYAADKEEVSLGMWMKIALLALLLGSSGTAVAPAYLPPEQAAGYGGSIASGELRMVIRNDGNLVLYRGPEPLPAITGGGP